MSNLLTYSRLRTYRECSRKHDLMYRQGWRPTRTSEALATGTLLHKGLAAWWRHLEADPETRLAAAVAAIASEPDAFNRIRIEELLLGYELKWGHTVGDFRVITTPDGRSGVEVEFTAPLMNPATGRISQTWVLAGAIDVATVRQGRGLIVEHKSTSESIDSDADSYWERLPMDHQLSLYVVGASALGIQVDEALYDVVRKPLIRPLEATPVEARKYRKDNGALYANQRDHDETPDEFRLRLREEIASNPSRYYQRRDVPRRDIDLGDFLADAWASSREIREGELAKRAPRNPEACLRMGRCAFFDVCANGRQLEAPFFTQLDHVHPELSLVTSPQKEEESHDEPRTCAA